MISGRRTLLLLGAVSLLVTSSCDPSLPTRPADLPVQGSVAGLVRVEGTGIQNIQISLSGAVVRTSVTDGTGRFRFEDLDEGIYVVTATGLPLDGEFAASVDSVEISRAQPSATVDFVGTWTRDAAIAVSVQVDGGGLAAATLTLQGPETVSGTTDGSGAAMFEGLRRGTWEVTLGGYDPLLHEFPNPSVVVNANGPPVRQVSFAGTARVPTTPTGLVATAAGATTIDLAWNDLSDNEERFDIERRAPGGEWSPLTSVGAGSSSFTDSGVDPASTWSYRVRACSVARCSEPSNEASATTDDVPPAPPTSLAVVVTGATSLRPTWTDASDNEDAFEVQRRQGAAAPWEAVGTTAPDAIWWEDGGLVPTTLYGYRVRGCNAAGCSAWTSEATGTTAEVVPLPPSTLSAVADGESAIDLTWVDASANETGFEVEKSSNAVSWSALVSLPAGSATFAHSGLASGATWHYRVRACNAVGCSPWSNTASATTDQSPPAAPITLTASATGETTIDLGWIDNSSNESSFEVERSPDGSSWGALITLSAGVESHTDPGLSGSETWHYRVRACNAAGCSGWSNPSSATTDAPTPVGPNLSIAGVYINQRIQRFAGDVPLVADLDGYLRVFVVANEPNSFTPDVRVDFYLGGVLADSETLSAPSGSVPQSVDESSLGSSWNVLVPGSLIQPGLEIEVVVDPLNSVSESVESDNVYPGGGGLESLDVRDTPTFNVTFVPIRQTVNGTVGDVSPGSAANFLEETRAMLPFADDNVLIRSEYSTDLPAVQSGNSSTWSAVLSELNTLRSMDGSSRYYYGVMEVTYGGGIAGVGYVGWPVALGWDKSGSAGGIAAHEWGHNLGRPHSPGCGASGADGSYPHADGRIGHWGLDVPSLGMRSPATYYDFMAYCGPEWISDYVFERIIDRVAPPTYVGAPSLLPGMTSPTQPAEPGLLVWGRIEGGEMILEPALEVDAPPTPPSGGDYTIQGLGADGSALFSHSFDPIPMADGDGDEGHFAIVIPLRSFDRAALARIRLSSALVPATAVRAEADAPARAPGIAPASVLQVGAFEAEVTWNPLEFPMVVVRDANTGEVLTLGRSGRVRVTPASDRVVLEFSNGLGTIETAVQVWR